MSEIPEKLKTLIEKGAEISGNVTSTALGFVFAGPLGAFGGATLGPLVSAIFKKIGIEISSKLLSSREEIRVGATYALAIKRLEHEIQSGKTLRGDDFYSEQEHDRSKAETIMEGTLLKARTEYEEKKLKYYSNFLANLNLNQSISFEKGNTLLRILEQLSYRQLTILSYFNDVNDVDLSRWEPSFNRIPELGIYQDFYSEIRDLYNQQLLQQTGPGVSVSIQHLKISTLGKTLYNLLDLSDISTEDKELIKTTIDEINLKRI